MKKGFFEELKDYLLVKKNELHEYIGYYETLLQNKDELKPLIDDCDKYFFEIRYDEDDTDGYTNGKFIVYLYEKDLLEDHGWQSYLEHHYEITLNYDERYWGYCECTSDMMGYNETHKCCGNGCDWVAPSFGISKIETIHNSSFNGEQRDLWELEKKWDTYLIDHKDKEKQLKLKRIEEQLKYYEEEKQRLLNN
ncbi:hypothetical protein AB1283_01080 [Bacillus sp. S13(2024)]|uniref:hypothetical protein n=1 Tax=Bacillus sp. S13(2024) TaxID=3162885 RepID=UPI003D20B62E